MSNLTPVKFSLRCKHGAYLLHGVTNAYFQYLLQNATVLRGNGSYKRMGCNALEPAPQEELTNGSSKLEGRRGLPVVRNRLPQKGGLSEPDEMARTISPKFIDSRHNDARRQIGRARTPF